MTSLPQIRGWIRATQPGTVVVELDEPALASVVRSLRERRQQRFARARLRAGLRRHLRSLGLPAVLSAQLASGGATGARCLPGNLEECSWCSTALQVFDAAPVSASYGCMASQLPWGQPSAHREQCQGRRVRPGRAAA